MPRSNGSKRKKRSNGNKRKPGSQDGGQGGIGKLAAHQDPARQLAEVDRLVREIEGASSQDTSAGGYLSEDDDERAQPSRGAAEEAEAVERWDPRTRPLQEGEVLEYDSSAYILNHTMRVEWPCLSFDVLRDGWGSDRVRFPLSAALVTGTQASRRDKNQLTVMKLTELHKTQHDDESDSSDDDEEQSEHGGRRRRNLRNVDPLVQSRSFAHPGGTNRIRSMMQAPHVVATMSDTGKAHIWDVRGQMRSLQIAEQLVLEATEGAESGGGSAISAAAAAAAAASAAHNVIRTEPLQTFGGHPEEGFAVAWSPVNKGSLLTGDCSRHIYLWAPQEGGSKWQIDKRPFAGHSQSVEDLQWSPTEKTVFASCSVDQSVRVWDTRCRKHSMLAVERAHSTDVNVLSWNPVATYLLASGSDDGSFKIWDLRTLRGGEPMAHFRWHSEPIVSLEWHPTDESVLLAASADNSVSWWDMSVEGESAEAEGGATTTGGGDVPPQLLFLHHGCHNVKEVHFHPQLPGVAIATAESGFSIFKPSNADPVGTGDWA
eukprot:INCI257.1.p2 GENE.INCI257.1~~INCI257.1.p2  ORF type:complete len:543 (+),score=112.62 INCI257.1:213-1841(+)